MKPISLASTLTLALVVSVSSGGCIPTYDYEGDYAMTYAVVTAIPGAPQPSATAGTTRVDIARGLGKDFLIDLGPSFCRVSGTEEPVVAIDDVPFIAIAPQACWHTAGETSYPMSVGGTAMFDEEGERLTIVLTGTIDQRSSPGKPLGSTTIQFTETW